MKKIGQTLDTRVVMKGGFAKSLTSFLMDPPKVNP